MRNKIDFGIDLGTTNSAIAIMENGVPTIKKSETLKDTIPSCITFSRKQDILVGDTAYNVLKNDSARALKTFEKGQKNTFIEFKRTMGTTHKEESSNMNRTFSSVELSAEVLKKLKSLVPDENISSIVITVPAKFLNPQNEATMQAAKLAGFKHIELLQEPVAAATAYGLGSKIKDGFWLVFDFGGGTFDAALIKAEEGILAVKDTEGDNWLGGKNLDEAIVDNLIIPYLQENYAIDFVINDSTKKDLLRAAVKFHAEVAKNELSFKDKARILTNLGDLPFEDENGEEPEIDLELTENDLEVIFSPIFQKAIDITKDVLIRNNLKGSDLGALILVGGPTYSPILRRMLKEQITDKVDTSVDPMTVVAKGAALFASTISVSDEVKETTRDKTKLQLDIKYEATTVELDEMVNLKVLKEKTTGNFPDKIYADIVRSDKAWSSGKKLIGERSTIIDVLLEEGRSNSFEVITYDEQGNKLECQPNQFSILQGIGGLNKMQTIPYHIGIGKWYQTEERDGFHQVKGLEKNKQIGKGLVGVINDLKTRSDIRAGMASDVIRIPIYQGDYNAEGTNPLLNHLICEVVITGEYLPKFLPKGSPVNITIKVDGSSLLKFSAEFPTIDHTEEVDVEIQNKETPSEETLTKEISDAIRTAQKVNLADISKNLEMLKEQIRQDGGSADGKLKILDGLRKELLKLDTAAKEAEWPQIEEALKDSFFGLEDLIKKVKSNGDDEDLEMGTIEAHLEEYRDSVKRIIEAQDIRLAKELIEEIGGIDRELRNHLTGGAVDVARLKYHDREFNNLTWKDKNKARMLVNQGLVLISEGRPNLLRPLLHQIWDLRIDDIGDTLE
jgi:molecular chaperone DnaK